MAILEIESMQDYCNTLKNYIEESNKNELIYTTYDFKKELQDIINNENLVDTSAFYLAICELFGKIARVLNGYRISVSNVTWLGGRDETFDRDNFILTLKSVWPEI